MDGVGWGCKVETWMNDTLGERKQLSEQLTSQKTFSKESRDRGYDLMNQPLLFKVR